MTAHGKWSQPGVPHRGWVCVDVENLGSPSAICEMCEAAEIRYVHHMQHADYLQGLGVGCVFAENMEQDYVGPWLCEIALRQRAARRRRTWERRQWGRIFPDNGYRYLNTEGFHLAVCRTADGRGLARRGQQPRSAHTQLGKRRCASQREAMDAGLDALPWAKEHLA